MEWITEGVIAGVATAVLGYLGAKWKFKKALNKIPTLLRYANFFIEAMQAIVVAMKAIMDKKITKEEVAEFRKEAHEAVDAGFDAIDKKKGNYEDDK